ncbi:hypothetical protein [[Scytonema hofmanni] UTEX B 1581]|uniref:hypothetical protein n=1 Tax=[Scytonema hofmanni] UTEX B 1581 TaxID=379535 RepID=UPI00163EE7D8|nr:hypothetical protein [[Scytonema hofmanni] UTEX B 1581]
MRVKIKVSALISGGSHRCLYELKAEKQIDSYPKPKHWQQMYPMYPALSKVDSA